MESYSMYKCSLVTGKGAWFICNMFLSLNYLLLSIAIERIEIPLHDPSLINQKRVVRSIFSVQPLWNPELEMVD